MAAITTITTNFGSNIRVRTAAAQATTGQTDWLAIPHAARFMTLFFNLTAVAGTTPVFTPALLTTIPQTLDDTYSMNLAEHTAFTGLTAAAMLIVDVGPGITGIANDTTNSATAGSYASLNVILPPVLGIKVTNDRTTGDETYTYTIDATFR